jgi:LIVCS family branched-chain amino acid:cation transporter
MGPFGVLARCITVAQGSFEKVLPGFPVPLFIAIFCAVIFAFTLVKGRVVSLIGATLTPVLLLSLACIFWFSETASMPVQDRGFDYLSFREGFLQGYQTMDLLAAFFFSAFILETLEGQFFGTRKQTIRIFACSCLLGMALLGGVYTMLVRSGGAYHALLATAEPQQFLGEVAMETLGAWGGIVLCMCVMLACLTTGIVLAVLFAEFFGEQICQKKIGFKRSMLVTLGITFFVASLEFSGIAAFIGPILEILYPVLIISSLQLVLVKLGYISNQRWLFPVASLVSLCIHWGL